MEISLESRAQEKRTESPLEKGTYICNGILIYASHLGESFHLSGMVLHTNLSLYLLSVE